MTNDTPQWQLGSEGTMTNDTTKGPVYALLEEAMYRNAERPIVMGKARTIDRQIADLKAERDDAEARARHSQEKRVEAEHAAEHLRRVMGIEDESIRCTAERERDAARELERWVRHDSWCMDHLVMTGAQKRECRCGLDDALLAVLAKQPAGGVAENAPQE